MIFILIAAALLSWPLAGQAAATTPNLVPNPGFAGPEGAGGVPAGWRRSALPAGGSSRVYLWQVADQKLLALQGGPDRGGQVECDLDGIQPHHSYLLEFAAYRPTFTNGVYLEVELFGRRHLLNQHLTYGRIQPLFLRVNSGSTPGKARLVIMNPHPEVLAFGSPSLRLVATPPDDAWQAAAVRLPPFFPVGIFAASLNDLPEIRAAGFNAFQSYESQPEAIRALAAAAARLELKYLPNFRSYQAPVSRELGGRPELLGFYLEDEPEGRSVPPEYLQGLKESVKGDHPGVLTAVAMLRPQMVAAYRDSADIFLIDPYPVPNMPMTWLADCLEEAATHVARERLWAVVQAFGGPKYQKDGWPRRPTLAEMRCLSYLAVVHGARGVFYFNYPEAHGDPDSWNHLRQIVGELQQLQPWLVRPNTPEPVRLEITSPFKADAAGRPAIHYGHKQGEGEHLLILVNVLEKPVTFYLHGFSARVSQLRGIFREQPAVVLNGNIREELGPYEVRLYRYRDAGD